jgi:hypothetical protein
MRRAAALALAPGTAIGAGAAEDVGDAAASKGAALEAQLDARLKRAVRTVPGTDTQYLIGGYARFDAIAARRRQEDDEQGTFFVAATPFGPADGTQRLSVRQSQINWLSRTPTGATPCCRRKWTPDWMTVAGASTLWIDAGGALRGPDELRRIVYASVNAVHRLTPTLLVGAELLWGEATRVSGESADNSRLQVSVRWLLFRPPTS